MMLERCGCAWCARVVIIGTLAWGACRVGDILGGAAEKAAEDAKKWF